MEKACVFIAGRKQTSDPKKNLKKQIGVIQVKAYHTSREKRKGEMDAEVFHMISADYVEFALKRTSKMFKMWHGKQGTGVCGVGYWTSKWEGNGVYQCPSCRKLNETADHLNHYIN